MKFEAKLTTNWRVTVPKEVRRAIGLKPGDKIVFERKGSGFIKVNDSPMVKQYITLARLYKLEIILMDIFPECNSSS